MQKQVLNLLEKGILLSPEIIDETQITDRVTNSNNKPLVYDSTIFSAIQNKKLIQYTEWRKYEKLKVIFEKTGAQQNFDQLFSSSIIQNAFDTVEIIESYKEKNVKKRVIDFINLYNNRFSFLQSLLRQRHELQAATSIRKIQSFQESQNVIFIALILEKKITKNNNIMLVLEDTTGTIKGIVTKTKRDLHNLAKDLTPDEVVGVNGIKGRGVVFINSLIQPDVALNQALKKTPTDEAAVFISDLHIGSKVFLKNDFERFIAWIKGQTGTGEQRAMTRKIRYLFILGDVVEGIGVYPNQEKDLEIRNIFDQYLLFCNFIKEVPDNIKIIICPGNHDSIRISEPQPPLPKELVEDLLQKENVILVSNPCTLKIGASEDKLKVLIYHGYSFPYYASTIESIRSLGGLSNTENIMEFLLKKRHLAPTHGSTQYQLGYSGDPLLIKQVPDFFVTGHIHRATIKNYRNITMLNCSCWISQTPYQEKRGIIPQPSRAIYVNLKTRESKILNFSEK